MTPQKHAKQLTHTKTPPQCRQHMQQHTRTQENTTTITKHKPTHHKNTIWPHTKKTLFNATAKTRHATPTHKNTPASSPIHPRTFYITQTPPDTCKTFSMTTQHTTTSTSRHGPETVAFTWHTKEWVATHRLCHTTQHTTTSTSRHGPETVAFTWHTKEWVATHRLCHTTQHTTTSTSRHGPKPSPSQPVWHTKEWVATHRLCHTKAALHHCTAAVRTTQ
jgi:hypothetical protein